MKELNEDLKQIQKTFLDDPEKLNILNPKITNFYSVINEISLIEKKEWSTYREAKADLTKERLKTLYKSAILSLQFTEEEVATLSQTTSKVVGFFYKNWNQKTMDDFRAKVENCKKQFFSLSVKPSPNP